VHVADGRVAHVFVDCVQYWLGEHCMSSPQPEEPSGGGLLSLVGPMVSELGTSEMGTSFGASFVVDESTDTSNAAPVSSTLVVPSDSDPEEHAANKKNATTTMARRTIGISQAP